MKSLHIYLMAICFAQCLLFPNDAGIKEWDETITRVEQLRRELIRHDDLYFRQGVPEISDAAYDQLQRELRELEQASPEAAAAAVVQMAPFGDDRRSGSGEILHRSPMLSLHKSYTEEDLRTFHGQAVTLLGREEIPYRLEPKVDGVAISAVYVDGHLKHVGTRGNGQTGEDVTAQIRHVECLPEKLGTGAPSIVELRGEVFVPLAAFHRLNRDRISKGKAPFTSARSVAAGSLRLKSLTELDQRELGIVIFGWGEWAPQSRQPSSGIAFETTLESWSVPFLSASCIVQGSEDLIEAVAALKQQRKDWPFASDGIVVKTELTADRERMGSDSIGPRWALACKFESLQAQTTLTDVIWQLGETGILTPVAKFEPVTLAGRTIQRASLYNKEYLSRHDYRVGDTVTVVLKGDVTPVLAGVEISMRPQHLTAPKIPERCPCCSERLTSYPGKPLIQCLNPACCRPCRPK